MITRRCRVSILISSLFLGGYLIGCEQADELAADLEISHEEYFSAAAPSTLHPPAMLPDGSPTNQTPSSQIPNPNHFSESAKTSYSEFFSYADWKVLTELPPVEIRRLYNPFTKKFIKIPFNTTCPSAGGGFSAGKRIYNPNISSQLNYLLKNPQICMYLKTSPSYDTALVFDSMINAGTIKAYQPDGFLQGAEPGMLPKTDSQKKLVKDVAPDLNKSFRKWAGRPGEIPKPDPERVHIAILDTAPDRTGLSALNSKGDTAPHGVAIANLIADLVCNSGSSLDSCAATIETVMVTGYKGYSKESSFTQDKTHSGNIGSGWDLALAITETVDRHLATRKETGQRLILNLSLALAKMEQIHIKAPGMPPFSIPPVWYDAMTHALEYARCHGALIVSAAGNRTFGDADGFGLQSGPRLPGSLYSSYQNFSFEACKALYCDPAQPSKCAIRASDFPANNASPPLLWAVGAVDSRGKPLASNAALAQPPIVAYGDHAVANVRGSSEWAAIVTGTSASTAVVSAAAALVWHYRPAFSPDTVMGIVYRNGLAPKNDDGNDVASNFCHDAWKNSSGKCPAVRVISACEALRFTCYYYPGDLCPTSPNTDFKCTARVFETQPAISLLKTDHLVISDTFNPYCAIPTEGPSMPECNTEKNTMMPQFQGTTPSSNPATFYANAATVFNQQPEVTPCTSCIFSNSILNGAAIINPASTCGNSPVTSISLTLVDFDGDTKVLTSTTVPSTTTIVPAEPAQSATLTLTGQNKSVCTGPLLVTQ